MKKVKNNIKSYDDLINNHYGHITPKKVKDLFGMDSVLANYYGHTKLDKNLKKTVKKALAVAKSFDNGEVLQQAPAKDSFEEYVVEDFSPAYSAPSSVTDIEFEEYVVESETIPPPQETVVPAQQSSWNASRQKKYVSRQASADQEYDLDIMDPITSNPSARSMSGDRAYSSPFSFENESAQAKNKKDTSKKSEEDFIADMQSILTGQKVFDPVTKKTVEKEQLGRQQSQTPPNNNANTEFKNEHAIFDKIAQSMQYANAYDLGTVDLDNRFSDFDRMAELQSRKPIVSKGASYSRSTGSPSVDSTDFLNDLDAIFKQQTVSRAASDEEAIKTGKDWPPRPSSIRPYKLQERIEIFGDFPYEADPSTFGGDGIKVLNGWKSDNIIPVSIPQLNGKKMGNQTISNGTINFHKQGSELLQKLWLAWEAANLLDRIQTFEGGYAARFIRNTKDRNPRPLSNHAWGTAFDINASTNGFGNEPALLNQKGCVRELVTIANENGFFWGGHFSGSKDGMHFELGKIIG